MDKTSTDNRKWNQSSGKSFGSVEDTGGPSLSADAAAKSLFALTPTPLLTGVICEISVMSQVHGDQTELMRSEPKLENAGKTDA
jgi:hypothetical protein